MNFNFSSLGNTNFSSNAGSYLRPYDIYKVNLTKIERNELKGSKDPDAVYPVISIEFTEVGDSNRTYSENIFIPTTEQDMERQVLKNSNGHENEVPSRFENFQFTLMQIVEVLNPDGATKIKENAGKIKTIDQFIDLVIKALSGKNKVETKLKLVGRNSGGTVYAALPRACGLNKKGEIFPVNFIGENVFFTNYELTQQKAYQNAKPTNMDKEESKDTSDVDLDNIDL